GFAIGPSSAGHSGRGADARHALRSNPDHPFGAGHHVHDQWPGSRNSVNVGVDQWDFRPVRVSEIIGRAAKLPVNKHWHDVEHGNELN
ncbi:hypothetical protein V8J36_22370, partial [Frigidibacter sp. MR17.14]